MRTVRIGGRDYQQYGPEDFEELAASAGEERAREILADVSLGNLANRQRMAYAHKSGATRNALVGLRDGYIDVQRRQKDQYESSFAGKFDKFSARYIDMGKVAPIVGAVAGSIGGPAGAVAGFAVGSALSPKDVPDIKLDLPDFSGVNAQIGSIDAASAGNAELKAADIGGFGGSGGMAETRWLDFGSGNNRNQDIGSGVFSGYEVGKLNFPDLDYKIKIGLPKGSAGGYEL